MHAGRILTLTIALSLFSGLALSEASEFSMVPSKVLIDQDETITVDVFLDAADYLGAWQVTIEVTGGDTGSLDLDDLDIDTGRTDYVFYGLNSIEVVYVPGGEMAAAMLDMNCPDITEPGYLGTATFTASSDATGVFNIRFVDDDERTFLNDCDAVRITPVTMDQGTYIGVEVDCLEDGHCDDSEDCTDDTCVDNDCVFTNDDNNTCTDGNDCTADTCSSGTCSSTNESSGTPCDDGLFCTETDECDGSGTCVGSGDPCPARRPNCCELLDVCSQWFCV